jgi:hypothetical protein
MRESTNGNSIDWVDTYSSRKPAGLPDRQGGNPTADQLKRSRNDTWADPGAFEGWLDQDEARSIMANP